MRVCISVCVCVCVCVEKRSIQTLKYADNSLIKLENTNTWHNLEKHFNS